MDGSSLNAVNGDVGSLIVTGVMQFDVAVFFAALGEDFETGIDAEHVQLILGNLFTVEIDGGSTGDFALRGHRELFGGGNCPLRASKRRGKGKQEREAEQTAA